MPVTLGVGFDVTGGSAGSRNTPADVIAAGTAGVDYDQCGPNHLFFYKHLWVNGYWEDTGWTLQFDNGVRCFMGGSGNWLSGTVYQGEHTNGAHIILENMGATILWNSASGGTLEWHDVTVSAIGGSRSDFFIRDTTTGTYDLYDCTYNGEAISSGVGDCGIVAPNGTVENLRMHRVNFTVGGDVEVELTSLTSLLVSGVASRIAVSNAPSGGWPLTVPNIKPASGGALGIYNTTGGVGNEINLLSMNVDPSFDPTSVSDLAIQHTQFGVGTNTINLQQAFKISLVDNTLSAIDARVYAAAQSDSFQHYNALSVSGAVDTIFTIITGDNDGRTTGGYQALANVTNRALYDLYIRRKDLVFQALAFDSTSVDFDSQFTLLTDNSYSASIPNEAIHATFVDLDEVYDYGKWWMSESANISWAEFFSAQGSEIDFGSVNVEIDASAASVWAYNGTTLTLHSANLGEGSVFDKIKTTGTITFLNGAVTTGIGLEDSTGVATPITITDLTSGNIQIEDNLGVVQLTAFAQTGSYDYLVPLGSTGTWKIVIDRIGYRRQVYTFTADGTKQSFSGSLQQFLNPDGTPMYTGTTSAFCTVVPNTAGTRLEIRIGNGEVPVNTIFDEVEAALATVTGMQYLGNGGGIVTYLDLGVGKYLFQGDFVRTMRDNPADAAATILGFVRSTDGIPFDTVNGEVQTETGSSLTEVDIQQIRYRLGLDGTTNTPSATENLTVDVTTASQDSIVDKVWDESLAAHLTVGSTGEKLNETSDFDETVDNVTLTTASEDNVVDKVWDEPIAGHLTAGSTGDALDDASTGGTGTVDANIVSVTGTSVVDVNDFKADLTGIATIANQTAIQAAIAALNDFDPATDLVDIGSVNGVAVTNINDFKADVSGLATAIALSALQTSVNNLNDFDPTSDTVDIGAVTGTSVVDINDFKADISTLATLAGQAATQALITGLNDFDPTSQTVDIGAVTGTPVIDVTDFHGVGPGGGLTAAQQQQLSDTLLWSMKASKEAEQANKKLG